MKKAIIPIAVGFITVGSFAINASAEEYNVEEGDTLGEIAKSHDMAVDDLKDINDLDSDIIQPDQVLTINEDPKTHDVEEGDTLSQLGNEYDVSVDELKDWNNLDSDVITIGQELALENAESDDDQAAEDEEEKSDESDQPSEDNNNEAEDDDTGDQSESEADESDESDHQSESEADESDESDHQSEEKDDEDKASEGETINVSSTAYTAQCEACSGTTTTGIDLEKNPDKKVIAVDPDVIPLGSEVHVEGYGDAVAADTGGAINGDKIDVFIPDADEANAWGNKDVEVTVKE